VEENLSEKRRPGPGTSQRADDQSVASGCIRAYLVHTTPAVAALLRRELENAPDIELVGAQTSTDHLEHRIVRSGATVLLLDGAIDAYTLTATIAAVSSAVKVIVLAQGSDSHHLVACLSAGAVGFLTGAPGQTDIGTAIRRAQEGWLALSTEQLGVLAAHVRFRPSDLRIVDLCARLSNRERQLLQWLATGVSIGEAAQQLGISTHTAQTHLKNAMRKLNARSKLAAIILAVRAGIIRDPITASDALPPTPRATVGPPGRMMLSESLRSR
jgi:DNA-binding NarL/FixJ family response regulator